MHAKFWTPLAQNPESAPASSLLATHLQREAFTSNRELCHMTKLGLFLIFLPMPLVRVVELTGDTAPDIRAIEQADVIVTTPEKWDGISRSWQNRWDQLA